ncbi:MAG: winged helix-turn-helix transcriptional regulator [Piscirickettsiaceae bacterium]|nr:winged helix-turn-helix transcriptional regulator [Piscirickettsiaceae bacterium]
MGPLLQQQVCYALYSTSGVITQAYRSLLEPLTLTYPQFVVMMALWQKDKVSVTELAQTVGLSKPTMTPLLKRLESLAYITREFEPGDERQKRITVTEQGRSFEADANNVASQALCATGLSGDEAEQLIALCQKIKNNLFS